MTESLLTLLAILVTVWIVEQGYVIAMRKRVNALEQRLAKMEMQFAYLGFSEEEDD